MNKEEIDKWLDNEYGVSYTSLEEIHDWLVDENMKKDKEIERLNNELQVQIEDNTRLNEYIEAQDKKLQQKENIIKEVREKIKEDNLYLEEAKKMYVEDTDDEMLKIHALQLINNDLSHIDSYLKILDKENK